MRYLKMLAGVAMIASLAACGNAAAEGETATAAKVEVQAVKNLEKRFIAGWEVKNPAVKTLYARDAVLVVPNAPPRNDPASIGKAFDRFAANSSAAVDFNNVATVISAGGDLAFSQGTYTSSGTNPETGEVQRGKGYYLLVYQKQADGSWKVIQDVSSPLPGDVERPSPL